MDEANQEKELQNRFYAVPKGTSLVFESKGEGFVSIKQLVDIATNISINNPDQQVKYWIQIEV